MLRMAFVNRKILRLSEYGRGRRKHHALAAVRGGCVQDIERTVDIVNRIFFGSDHRFAGRFESRQVDKSVKAFCKGRIQIARDQNRSVYESVFFKKILAQSARKIVDNGHAVIFLHQFFNDVAADISGAADYQHVHVCLRYSGKYSAFSAQPP